MKYILTCSCFKMDKKAAQAFSVIFPNEVQPEIIKGKDRLYKLAQAINNEHIKAISKLTGKFAYYVHLEDNKIVEEYDLLRGSRVA